MEQEGQGIHEPLYQVWAENTETGALEPVPFFPRVMQATAEEYAATMRKMIALGKERRYSNPKALLHLATLQ
jgi:hypothetical protein